MVNLEKNLKATDNICHTTFLIMLIELMNIYRDMLDVSDYILLKIEA